MEGEEEKETQRRRTKREASHAYDAHETLSLVDVLPVHTPQAFIVGMIPTAPTMLRGVTRQCGGCLKVAAQGQRMMMISSRSPSFYIEGGSNGRCMSTSSKEKKAKKKKGDGEGGDASKNAWYIKIVDQPPGPG